MLDLAWQAAYYNFLWHLEEYHKALTKAGYNPNQPRVPAGNPDGGQWTGGGGGSGGGNSHDSGARTQNINLYPDAIEPVYPIEAALTFFTGGQVVAAVRSLRGLWAAGATASSRRIGGAAKAIEDYLGGPGRTIEKNGNFVFIRGSKKVRLDIGNPGRDKPHFQIEKQTPRGNWKDAGAQHRYYFRKGERP